MTIVKKWPLICNSVERCERVDVRVINIVKVTMVCYLIILAVLCFLSFFLPFLFLVKCVFVSPSGFFQTPPSPRWATRLALVVFCFCFCFLLRVRTVIKKIASRKRIVGQLHSSLTHSNCSALKMSRNTVIDELGLGYLTDRFCYYVDVWCTEWNGCYNRFCHKGHLQYLVLLRYACVCPCVCLCPCVCVGARASVRWRVFVRLRFLCCYTSHWCSLFFRCSAIRGVFRSHYVSAVYLKIDLNTVICSADFIFNSLRLVRSLGFYKQTC